MIDLDRYEATAAELVKLCASCGHRNNHDTVMFVRPSELLALIAVVRAGKALYDELGGRCERAQDPLDGCAGCEFRAAYQTLGANGD